KFYILMRFQNVSKINYVLRNVYINIHGEFYKRLNQIKSNILTNLIPFSMSRDMIKQSELAIRLGGLACRNIKQLSCVSYISRAIAIVNNSKRNEIMAELIYNKSNLELNKNLEIVLNRYNALVNEKNRITSVENIEMT